MSRSSIIDSKIAPTPLEHDVRLINSDGTLLSNFTLNCQLIGCLICLTVTLPDIAHVVHIVSQFMIVSQTTHYVVVLRILRYIKMTMFHILHFFENYFLELYAYSNAK